MKAIIVIPARLESTRLPKKALADIAGKPMIEWVINAAKKSNVGEVIVATCGDAVKEAVNKAGAKAIVTDPDLPSGTDRVWAAYVALGKPKVEVIIGLQGDLPLFAPSILQDILKPFKNDNANVATTDVATLACKIHDQKEIINPNVVKIAMDEPNNNLARAMYFSRAAVPVNAQTFYHHIGVYAYRPTVLEAFVNQSPCYLEKTERLEQLRFLQHGFRIDVAIVDSNPISVDTQEDLDLVRNLILKKK